MSADQETRLWLTMLRDYIETRIKAALPFVRDGKLDLSSKNIVGAVPPTRLPASATTIRGATDYDDTTAPTDGQVIAWDESGGKFGPANQTGGGGTLASLSDVSLADVQDGQVLVYDAANALWRNGTIQYPVTLEPLVLDSETLIFNGDVLTIGVD